MVIKDTYDYEQKNQIRNELKDFVSEAYPGVSQRRNLKVLTLLGHEDKELIQVWDALGIPRENITSVEHNKDVYNAVADKNLDIRLISDSIDDFMEKTNEKFDIINLDYQGYFSSSKRRTLNYIASKEILGKSGVLATWFSGRREDKNSLYLRDSENRSTIIGNIQTLSEYMSINPLFSSNDKFNLLVNYIGKRAKMISEGDNRSDFISDQILSAFQYPALHFQHHPLIKYFNLEQDYFNCLKDLESTKERNKLYLEAILKNDTPIFSGYLLSKESFEAFKVIREKALRKERMTIDDERLLYKDFGLEGSLYYVRPLVKRKVDGFFKSKRVVYNNGFIEGMAAIIADSYTNEYSNKKLNRFLYHSDNGTPMYVDMNIFEKIDYSNFFPWKFNEKKQLNIPLSIIKDCNSVNRLLGKLDKYVDTCMTNFLWSKELRKELEPSKIAELNIGLLKNKNMYINSDRDTVPCSDNANRLSNDEIYSLLSQGKSAEEIMSMDDSLTPKKIGARKAWLTMRNEQSNTALDENIADKIVEILDSGKADEKIAKTTLLSKEDILMLLKEYSPAEITNTFPSNYTLFQIRAFKKHMTMGRYKEIA